ncbi:MAG: PH domain-containing protein, partial [Steroidobacteraceae bacterium]
MAEEREVWFGSPSQVLNLGTFILMGLFFWLVIPLFIILWKWLVIKTTKYEITTERVRTRRGVFNKETEELELYRVRDYRLE